MKQVKHIDKNHWPKPQVKTIDVLDLPQTTYINILNDLTDIHLNLEHEKVESIINRLESYANVELKKEEDLLIDTAYPKAVAHIALHKIFSTKVDEFKQELKYHNLYIASNILAFLKKWLISHIIHQDSLYVIHVQSALTAKDHWPTPLQINYKVLDEPQFNFVAIFNDILDNKDADEFEVSLIIERLESYTQRELKREEDLLVKSGYSDAQKHIEQHLLLSERLKEFRHEIIYDNPYIVENMLNFLKKWLISHIIYEDDLYRNHVINYLNTAPQEND